MKLFLDLENPLPVVLNSGGVGLTPMMSMLNTLIENYLDRKVFFIHAPRNSKVMHSKNTPGLSARIM
jgi:nitric oxide dioxygenase